MIDGLLIMLGVCGVDCVVRHRVLFGDRWNHQGWVKPGKGFPQ
jgi:hypothetical protein